jgi:hypothetical protein
MRRINVVAWCIVGLWAVTAHAQFIPGAGLAVQEVGQNLFYNSLQAADAVVNTASWALNLGSFETIALTYGSFAEDMAKLQQIAADGMQLLGDEARLQGELEALFNVAHAPHTSAGYAARLWMIRQAAYELNSYVMRTQTLVSTTLGVLQDINQLAYDLLSILGTVNGMQELAQQQSRLLQVQSELKTAQLAFQRAQMFRPMEDAMTGEFIHNFNEESIRDMPTELPSW